MRWVIEVHIDPDLVADGLDLSSSEHVQERLCRAFPFARSSGIHVAVIEAPSPEEIRKAQGWPE